MEIYPAREILFEMEKKIDSLPNIGKELAKKLKDAGISTPEDLRSTGSEQAFLRLKIIDPGACLNSLFALEGAVQEIRWHFLSEERKRELREFFKMINE